MKNVLAVLTLVASALAQSALGQVRLSIPAAPLGGVATPLVPFQSSPAAALSPVLSPMLAPAMAPSIAPAPLPEHFSDYRRLFDGGAAAKVLNAVKKAKTSSRGEGVSLNGVDLPARAFSDQTSIAGHLIQAIDAAHKSIDIAIHGLALREILEALLRAKNRGVKIRIVMNQTHIFPENGRDKRTPEVQALIDQGFKMKMLRGSDQYGIMHNKFAVFDGKVLETGSFNWTRAADTLNWENAMFLAQKARIVAYQIYWDWMWSIASEIPSRAPPAYAPSDDGSFPSLPPAPQDSDRPIVFNGETFPAEAFSPGGVTAQLVRAIDASRKTIDLAVFSFTSDQLREALLRAKNRGVIIRIVFDASQYKYQEEMPWFVEKGFDVLIANGKKSDMGVMHNKFAIFDGALVETGSFNWTRNGEKNSYENAVFLDAPDDIAGYEAYFLRIRARARKPGPGDHLGLIHAPEAFFLMP
jgi:phosphatidylserine/phosphatidylglycerophosphate/cardiolipin synthase-like enzyme